MSAAPFNIAEGQHFLCRYDLSPRLSNGDLIAARVLSVPGDGTVLLTNLLGGTSRKKIATLQKRNWHCPPSFTALVVERFRQTGSRTEARKLAVELYRETRE
jgi:hypothetical protein